MRPRCCAERESRYWFAGSTSGIVRARPVNRYTSKRMMKLTPVWVVMRVRLSDADTGDELELRNGAAAAEARLALERADAGGLEPLPIDASPFRRYEVVSLGGGWHYLTRVEGTADHGYLGRTRNKAFADRVADAMNRLDPRLLTVPKGPTKIGWF